MRSTSSLRSAIMCICRFNPARAAVLARMQRLYTRDDYMRRIDWMKNAKRDIAITTDIIVGFPGETEADFNETIDLIEEVEYDSMFIFKYSKRPNTSALALRRSYSGGREDTAVHVLQERQRAIQMRRNGGYVGKTEEVHVEGYNVATGQWIGTHESK